MTSRERKLRQIVERAGWSHRFTRGGHQQFVPPPGATDADGKLLPIVTCGKTSSDWRAARNVRAILRRAGIDTTGL